jgi:hydrogenase-4 component E
MTGTAYAQLLDLACGALLATAVAIVWRRRLTAIIRTLAVQGVALAAIAAVLAVHTSDARLGVVAAGVLALRGVALPWLLGRALGPAPGGVPGGTGPGSGGRETRPLANVTASLLTVAALMLVAYAVSRPVTALEPSPAADAIGVGIAVALTGFYVLVTRRRAVAQLAGFLLMDNGITATGFLTTAGTGLIVEAGVSLDVLLAVVVLRVLTGRMREAFGDTDLDDLRELRD